jgi:ABC-type transport system involved in cytochrome c biogenesis permease subunit
VAELVAPAHRRLPLAVGLGFHLLGLLQRARVIAFFPLSNKFESFYAFALAVMLVVLFLHPSPSRAHRLGTFAVGALFYLATLAFERHASFPPPLMQTIWYPLHVPATFLAYALWLSSAAAGAAVLAGDRAPALRASLDGHAFWGWCVFSVSMVFGGIWGYVAWGAYFLWDPKVVWSVILWLFYSGFVHLRFWPPGNRPRSKAALSLVGVAIMLVAYVGTSFLFGHGSHSFG